jgi:hypothetical protein
MKIAITGHTSGLGQAFYNHFSLNNEVIGLSRSNGYDIRKNQKEIVDIVSTCDLFFNNAHYGIDQGTLLVCLCNRLPIVTSGSMGADYFHTKNQYYRDKHTIEMIHKQLTKKRTCPLLLLKMGYLENYRDRNSISYNEIIKSVEFWLDNPKVTMVEFDNII